MSTEDTNSGGNGAEVQEILPNAEANFPESFKRCCTSHLRGSSPSGNTRIDGMKAILAEASVMWESGRVLTVGFVGTPPGTPIQQGKVKGLVKGWEAAANIKFQFIPNGKDATIRIGFRPNDGAFSYIGRDALRVPRSWVTMNLGFTFNDPVITDDERGSILHQFGHVLGFLDEHFSPRRGEKLTFNEALIIDVMKRTQVPPWDEQMTRRNILDLLTDAEVTDYSEMDLKSVMMYFIPPEWNFEGITVGPNKDISPVDKAFAFLNYPFIGGPSSDPSMTLTNALDVAGVTGVYRKNIETEFAEGDWQGVRAELARWSLNQRAAVDKAVAVRKREAIASAPSTAAATANSRF